VYLAENPDIARQVAIKTLTRHAVDKAVLLGEAHNVGRLIAGESLCSLLRKGPAEAADIFK